MGSITMRHEFLSNVNLRRIRWSKSGLPLKWHTSRALGVKVLSLPLQDLGPMLSKPEKTTREHHSGDCAEQQKDKNYDNNRYTHAIRAEGRDYTLIGHT